MFRERKIAIVYDWIDKWGGVERVLLTLHDVFPNADFYTSYYDSEKAPWAKDLKIKTSFIQKLPKFIKKNRILSFPLYSYAFESLDFKGYNLVISVTSSFAKAVITRPETRHVCYLLTPTRYLWLYPGEYVKNKIISGILAPYINKMKKWDMIVAQRPDKIISISQTVADRCKKYYNRESEVVYPPFDIKYWTKIKSKFQSLNLKSNPNFKSEIPEKYFLVVSRLEPYKKIDLIIKVFNKQNHVPSRIDRHQDGKTDSKHHLIIVGEGSEEKKLKEIAGENITFLSKLTDEELVYLYSKAEALIMPQEEDFGYVALEAQFFGCPVIAYNKGGASITVSEGKTGLFFHDQTVEELSKAIGKYNMVKYKLQRNTLEFGPKNVERFAKEKFVNEFKRVTRNL
ncbi:hypothetical protein A2866_05340 [Candidatus Roizmanbacteria bacterium RIFCSPHIGHO2_01_FULL_39_8]|uniref:Glycosyl transferase family 1 domain-containing protein n=3 Tax=Candidatus Roizmaniibacteriota TaxID=1752723 RepID=A0A1F7GTQ0_9BACT|nr:MAG: hypothetical protein A2866_05340 [Candidatus Roizmanbacteria bacterium RIFCSPHIGHO2_01_FULL_39_8]OGK25551.1 MAG: hypothetical protein A3C28_01700 [Candidatus Roizmanbacteria bacterium RIFCSPHIGHO2_02_FULL_39_9]